MTGMCLLTVCVGGKVSMNVLSQSNLLLVLVQDLPLIHQSSSDMEDLTFKGENHFWLYSLLGNTRARCC